MSSRRIALIATGGTVSKTGPEPYNPLRYHEEDGALRKLGATELAAAIADGVPAGIEVVPVDFLAVSSRDIGFKDWLALGGLVSEHAKRVGPEGGVIVTHGTATLEETAFFLELTYDGPCPVVVVGAMRPLTLTGSDAARNLLDALRLAGAPQSRGRRVVALLNGVVHAPQSVSKRVIHGVHAFDSDASAIGSVEIDGEVELRPYTTAEPIVLPAGPVLPRVDIALSYLGADGAGIRAFVDAGAAAIVSAGQAFGLVTASELDALREASERGVHVIQASRVGEGRTHLIPAHRRAGFISSGRLAPLKARVLALVALAAGADREELARLFSRY